MPRVASVRALGLFCWALGAVGCASTVDGAAADGVDGGRPRDVAPGLNPDGFDPFRPVDGGVDAGPLRVDGGTGDVGEFVIDGSVFDQRSAYMYIGNYLEAEAAATYVTAEFRYIPRPDDPRCMVSGAASWDLQNCDLAAASVADPHPTPFPNAGAVRVSGGSEAVALSTARDGRYQPYYELGSVFARGGEVTVTAPGSAAVPPLNLRVTVPPPLQVIDPPGDALVIDRTRDLTVRFAPSPARAVWVILTLPAVSTANGRWVRINNECYGDTGVCTIPRRALQNLPPTREQPGSLTVMPYNITTTRVGAWPLSISAVGLGRRYSAVVR